MKLSQIKMELAKLLVKYSVVKTDNGILNFEGDELTVGNDVFVEDENGEKIIATDGEYKTEDNKIITVVNGKVESIVEVETELEEDASIEDVENPTEDTITEDTPTELEEIIEEVVEKEEVIEMEDTQTAIDELRKEVNELYKIVDSLLKRVDESRAEADERFKKIECASMAKPAVEEFETITSTKKTGDSKLDNFLSKFSK